MMPAAILCVDNDVSELERLGKALEAEGFRVLKARDVHRAVVTFMRERVELVLLDFALSQTDGGIVAFEMRRRKPDVKLAFLTADPSARMPREIVDAVIEKSTDARMIVPKVRQLLGLKDSRVA